MKQLLIVSISFVTLMASCISKKKLRPDDALKQIKQEMGYPKVIDFDIYCSDPMHGRKVLDAGLESEGLVYVLKTQKLGELNKPLITLTEKAKPFLLSRSEKEKAIDIQKVKLADEDVGEVTNIKTNGAGNKAIVTFTTTFKNLTPFVRLTNSDFKKTKTNKAYFSLSDDGWKLEKKPDLDFVELEK